jgi:hypothetical protein
VTTFSYLYLVVLCIVSSVDKLYGGYQGLAVDQQGHVYICGRDSHNIHRLSPDGTFRDIVLSKHDGVDRPRSIFTKYKNPSSTNIKILHLQNIKILHLQNIKTLHLQNIKILHQQNIKILQLQNIKILHLQL